MIPWVVAVGAAALLLSVPLLFGSSVAALARRVRVGRIDHGVSDEPEDLA